MKATAVLHLVRNRLRGFLREQPPEAKCVIHFTIGKAMDDLPIEGMDARGAAEQCFLEALGWRHDSGTEHINSPLLRCRSSTVADGGTDKVKAAAARFGDERKAVEARIRVRQDVIKERKW
ncbi:MAG: hypothetical protein ACRDJ4_03870 [Actinomycetota bacterium]